MKTASTFLLCDNQMRMFLSFFFFRRRPKEQIEEG